MASPVSPVPDGTILFHAGFHKTGTTALQSALEAQRAQLLEAGVLYPGEGHSHHRAAMAVTGRRWGWGEGARPPRATYWESLRDESLGHGGRVIISSEAFALARGPAVDQVVAELGADRLHAVFTLRPFAKLLASSYQQYLKYGLGMPYAQWLENVFANPPKCPPSPNFWRRNDHAGVMGRWAKRLGADRVTLVVLDDADRGALFRTFEGLLGLPDGLLVPDSGLGASNRSMTAAEAEMLRLVNAGGARQWDWPAYQDGVRRGAVMRMVESRTPGRDEPMLATPAWAVGAAQEFGRSTAQRVATLGINVLGDPTRLADPIPAADPPTQPPLLPVDAAAQAVLGGILGALGSEPTSAGRERALEQARKGAIDQLPTRAVAGLLAARVSRARRRHMARVRRRVQGQTPPTG
jgi:hypothetical protein